MVRQRIFLTGATGTMGVPTLHALLSTHSGEREITVLALDTKHDHQVLDPLRGTPGLRIVWGDLTSYDDVLGCVRDADVVMHIAAFVSPAADYQPERAMRINYGSTQNIVRAIYACGQQEHTALVYIGTVAETGDRMPPIHWGRVGDPIKPSVFDYYAVSKVAAERLVIESGLARWASLRQTGIMGPAMGRIRDAIMFHNCIDNVLEYVSDRDSGRMMGNLADALLENALDEAFWGHVYNVGGGAACRASTYDLYRNAFATLGITNLGDVISPKLMALRNFHGTFYLDSDRLEGFLHFRRDTLQYFYESFRKGFGALAGIVRAACRIPGGGRAIAAATRSKLTRLARSAHGTLHYIENNVEDHIDAFWGSRAKWEALPERLEDFERFGDWEKVVPIDHGYDESKPESALNLGDVRSAAKFRGGSLVSDHMAIGDWTTKLTWRCAFGHTFEASPRLVLEGGHWCPVCERTSWNYGKRAQVDPFFAQVWNPLHDADELHEYPKEVSELDV